LGGIKKGRRERRKDWAVGDFALSALKRAGNKILRGSSKPEK